MPSEELQARLDELWSRHRLEILERFTQLACGVKRLTEGETDAAEFVQAEAHKLVSVLGAFGFGELAMEAAALEQLVREPLGDDSTHALRASAIRLGSGMRKADRPLQAARPQEGTAAGSR